MAAGERVTANTSGVAAAITMALAVLTGCEPIHDPWVTGNEYFAEERQRTPEQQKALRERALYQAGPSGATEAEDYESSRFIEK
jgi:hypothetical protein